MRETVKRSTEKPTVRLRLIRLIGEGLAGRRLLALARCIDKALKERIPKALLRLIRLSRLSRLVRLLLWGLLWCLLCLWPLLLWGLLLSLILRLLELWLLWQ